MSYELSDSSFKINGGSHYTNGPHGSNRFQNKEPDCRPLLRPFPSNNNFNNNRSLNYQNRNNPQGNQHYRTPIYSRLGSRNFQHKKNNAGESSRLQYNNRKRKEGNIPNTGPTQPKRKWVNKSFYPSANLPNHVSVQDRLDKIRTNTEEYIDSGIKQANNESGTKQENYNELDATDITVEVVNHAAVLQPEDNLTKFKMILNPKTQAAIKFIQSKRKDKQVIFPFPVTPNCTEISINERFSLL